LEEQEVIIIPTTTTQEAVESSGSASSSSSMGMFIGIGVGCVVVLLLILFFVTRYSKNKRSDQGKKGTFGGTDIPNVEMGEFKKDDDISKKDAEHIKKLASSISFSNLLATLDNEFENADNIEENQRQLPSYKKKRAIFESVWKDRDGVKFDIAINYPDDVVVTREGLENILGAHVTGVCLIHHLELTENAMSVYENSIRARGKICDKDPNPDRIILDDLVESVDNGSLRNAIAKGLRMKKLPELDVYAMDLENISSARKTNRASFEFSDGNNHEQTRMPGSRSKDLELNDDDMIVDFDNHSVASYSSSTECYIEVEIFDERLVGEVLEQIKRRDVMPTVTNSSRAVKMVCKGTFTQIAKVKESVSTMKDRRTLGDVVKISPAIRVHDNVCE